MSVILASRLVLFVLLILSAGPTLGGGYSVDLLSPSQPEPFAAHAGTAPEADGMADVEDGLEEVEQDSDFVSLLGVQLSASAGHLLHDIAFPRAAAFASGLFRPPTRMA